MKRELTPWTSPNRKKYESRNPLKRIFVRRFLDVVRDCLAEVEACTILDAGCGEGIVTQEVVRLFPRAKVVGVDTDPILLSQARERNPSADFREGTVTDLPFDSDAFDLVICSEVLEHVPDAEKGLAYSGIRAGM